jgi:hypothetical protein
MYEKLGNFSIKYDIKRDIKSFLLRMLQISGHLLIRAVAENIHWEGYIHEIVLRSPFLFLLWSVREGFSFFLVDFSLFSIQI